MISLRLCLIFLSTPIQAFINIKEFNKITQSHQILKANACYFYKAREAVLAFLRFVLYI